MSILLIAMLAVIIILAIFLTPKRVKIADYHRGNCSQFTYDHRGYGGPK